MGVVVTTEVRGCYLLLHCAGVYDYPSAVMIFDQAFDAAKAEGLCAVLVDARQVEGAPTTMDRYNWGVHIANRSAAGLRIWIAVVGNEGIIDPDRFGETVAFNRGAFGRAFTDFTEAIAWLEARPEGTPCVS